MIFDMTKRSGGGVEPQLLTLNITNNRAGTHNILVEGVYNSSTGKIRTNGTAISVGGGAQKDFSLIKLQTTVYVYIKCSVSHPAPIITASSPQYSKATAFTDGVANYLRIAWSDSSVPRMDTLSLTIGE